MLDPCLGPCRVARDTAPTASVGGKDWVPGAATRAVPSGSDSTCTRSRDPATVGTKEHRDEKLNTRPCCRAALPFSGQTLRNAFIFPAGDMCKNAHQSLVCHSVNGCVCLSVCVWVSECENVCVRACVVVLVVYSYDGLLYS